MTDTQPKHAKNRPPSAAKRWLSCPQSAFITPLYPNDETDASLKGDAWHSLMETRLIFGTTPLSADPDAVEAMEVLADYVAARREIYGPSTEMYVEQQLDIVETGEFGTADVILVSDKAIEIIDEKSGYVPVGVRMNPQMLVYLLGAIAKFGERKNYRITVHQPNYDHIDGQIRSYDVSSDDIGWIRSEIKYSISNPDQCTAGKHCKETYCPHRAACAPFASYVARDLSAGWFPSEVRAIDDNQLALSLDHADQIAGYQKELRAEALRRIAGMDRKIEGYKVCKGRKERSIHDHTGLIIAVYDKMGIEWAAKLFKGYSWISDFEAKLLATLEEVANTRKTMPQDLIDTLGTPKHIEDIIKLYARQMNLPRGAWKAIYENVVGEYIREYAQGLALEKEIYGKPAHRRGSEFSAILPGITTEV